MGIDFGDKRIGLAISDPQRRVATTITNLAEIVNDEAVYVHLSKIVEQNEVSVIILGWPVEMSGAEGKQCEKVAEFARHLYDAIQKPIILIDERLTTKAVMSVMREAQLTRKQQTAHKDMLAALYILQTALENYRMIASS